MAQLSVYYYDGRGYLTNDASLRAGATSLVPPTAPAGQLPRWTGSAWTLAIDYVDADAMASLQKILAYDPVSGALTSVTAGPDADGNSYKQTLSYTNGALTGVSSWVKQ